MSNFKSMKGAADGTVWNPTSVAVKGKDGKDYNTRAKNPDKGKEPTLVGYYIGADFVESKKPDQKGNNLHKFKTQEGDLAKVWGSHDLDQQLAAGVEKFGIGRLTQIQWNGYLVKQKSKDKPEEVLAQKLPADHYHDWEVAVDDVTPAIKVEGAEVYKSNTTNEAKPATPSAKAADPIATMPATLDDADDSGEADQLPDPSEDEDEDDLPF